jgi:L-ascorbate metabolism protein UlaG (beta-lactamase superfamily)/rhodanese-related sulfurtransferase
MSLLSLLGLFACGNSFTNLSVDEFESSTGNMALIDVRTAEEYADGHLRNASNVDWYADDFLSQIQSAYPSQTPLAIYCRSGRRSADAAKKLAKAGYTVYNLLGGYLAWTEAGKPTTTYEVETFFTDSGKPVSITLIKHGSLAIYFNGEYIQVDPVGGYGKPTDYAAEFPKAKVILVTHEHGDHFDKDAIAALTEEGSTTLITNARCAEMLGYGTVMANGDKGTILADVAIDAVPAYNYTEGHTQFHPKGRDNGFVLTIDGLRIYIAGDTEDIPEMAQLHDIDIAFLPVNQPYTMTVDQCVNAARVIGPKVLIPYHFSATDLSALPAQLPGITVLLRQMQ